MLEIYSRNIHRVIKCLKNARFAQSHQDYNSFLPTVCWSTTNISLHKTITLVLELLTVCVYECEQKYLINSK